ncbi:aminotransferase class IV [Streptomyces sp. AN091965]|uniref:aminotransferase class IV n=1 Tax=Streptomyces sp. AN091965 TaxID=2927803 RepID=UPI001F61051C|nr:aminotransferase class IV [Streptomyces sp. AN091965]MCI3930548.1 aminotransferase class IV [Streptomyces sp. AN091965]
MTTSNPAAPDRLEIDGAPATAEQLRARALDGFGHFTAMQVRGGTVRGLSLHLERLDAASRELFDQGLDGDRVRAAIRHALAGDGSANGGTGGGAGGGTAGGVLLNAAVRVYVHAPDGEPSLMVTVRPPVELPATMAERAQSLKSVPYVRPAAHLKHLGGFGQTYHRREAERLGYDEALLTGPDGAVSEGAVTNVAFFDGREVVWPEAPHLRGITMGLLEPRLADAGLPTRRGPVFLRDLPSYRAAFVTNSWGVSPVRRVDDHDFPVDEKLMATVADLYEGVPGDVI